MTLNFALSPPANRRSGTRVFFSPHVRRGAVPFLPQTVVETIERGAEPRLKIYTFDVFPAFHRVLRKCSTRRPDLVGLDAALADWLTSNPQDAFTDRASTHPAVRVAVNRGVTIASVWLCLFIAGRSPVTCRRNDSRLRWRSGRPARGWAAGDR